MKTRKQVAAVFNNLILHKLCVTKSAFAKMINMDRQRIHHYCSGKYYPDYRFFAKAKDAGIDVSEFF